jgi:enoyl-CoA hydratase/carnithine racemase
VGEFVTVTEKNRVATIRLDRPPINALNTQIQHELQQAAKTVSVDTDIRSVVLYGGDKVFAAGADVKEIAGAHSADIEIVSRAMQTALDAIAGIGKPVIAAINGYALGGGLELALCADFRVCGRSARLGLPEILLGIIPGGGGTQRLPRLIGPARAKNLIFTGRFLDAQEALAIGLIDEVVEDVDTYEAATRLAGRFHAGPPLAINAAKQTINAGLDLDLNEGLELERQRFSALFGTEDQRIGMSSFIQHGPGKAHFVGR